MNIKDIKPKGKESDKHSIQLYNYLKKYYRNGSNVYYVSTQYQWDDNLKEGKYINVEFDENNVHPMHIWIGRKSNEIDENTVWYHGNTLNTILGSGRCRYINFANPWYTDKKVIDITNLFWEKYIEIGRCIWDHQHTSWFANDNDRFTYLDENTRKCNWCGVKQTKIETPVISIKTDWILV
jgi:hypothetical protein